MPVDFCTLFDARYLTRALVMHRSLRRVMPESRLWAFCMDEEAHELLGRLGEPGIEPVPLAELELHDPELAAVKATRSRVEYMWTATPAVCLFLLERHAGLGSVTYLDADLMFFSSPQPLLDELGNDSVLIVPHRYAPPYADQEAISGKFNVEWLTFRRDERGLAALSWWRERCIEWCYVRPDNGRFGDQKYLDDWPERFEGVHVLRHPGGGVGPWNESRHELVRDGESISVDGSPLVFFHFHGLALHRGSALARALARLDPQLGPHASPTGRWSGNYPVGDQARSWIWEPYLVELDRALHDVRLVSPSFEPAYAPVRVKALARRAAGSVVRSGSTLGPGRRVSGGRASAADWSSGVAAPMLELSKGELTRPSTVSPFVAFRYALEVVLEDDTLDRPVELLDIGCGVGQYGELSAQWFPQVQYTGCDVSEEMIEAARVAWPTRTFELDDVLAPRLDYGAFDVLLAGALVDVLVEWREAMENILGSPAPYVILHRQRMTASKTRVRRASGYRGQTTFRTVISEGDLSRIVARHGRTVVRRFPVVPGVATFVVARSRS